MSSQKAASTRRATSKQEISFGPEPAGRGRSKMRTVMEHAPVASVMSRTIPLASPDASAADLEWIFSHQDVDAVLVVQGDPGVLIGVVTKSDLIRARQRADELSDEGLSELDVALGRHQATRFSAALDDREDDEDEDELEGYHLVDESSRQLPRAADVMSSVVVVVQPQISVAQAMGLMAAEGVSCLPVVEHGERDRLVGLISAREVIHWLAEQTGHVTISRSEVLFEEWSEEAARPPSLISLERCLACRPRCPGC